MSTDPTTAAAATPPRARRWVRAAAAAAALAAAFGVLVATREPGDPGRRSLHDLLLQGSSHAAELQARVTELGPAALPALADALEWEPAPWHRFANANRFPRHQAVERRLRPWRTDPPAAVHVAAANLIGCLDADAAPALPELRRYAAAGAFAYVPSPVFRVLAEQAPDDPAVHATVLAALGGRSRDAAITGLSQARALPAALVAPVAETLARDTNAAPGALAALARRLGPAASAWIPGLARRIAAGGPDAAIAADALAALRPAPGDVLPALRSMLAHASAPVACNLFVALGTNAAALEPALELRARDRVPQARVLAARSLAAIRGRPAECVPALLVEMRQRGLGDPQATYQPAHDAFDDPFLGGTVLTHREAAAWLLGEMGADASAAAPALRGAAGETAGWLPVVASWSLWRVTRRAEDALPGLARALESGDPWQRHFALQAAAEMGPAAAVLAPRVRACAALDLRHRRDAARALAAFAAPR